MGCVRSLEIPIQLGLSPLEETPCSRRTPRVSSPSSLPWAHASIYPAIDPEPLYATKSYGGNVVLVTGASRGVGRETALQYAHAGALVPILARSGDALEEMKNLILADVPGADVLVLTADVCDVEAVWGAVQSVTGALGSLIYSLLMQYPLWKRRASDACISIFAVDRLVESIALEYPSVRVFALAPGLLPTCIAAEAIPFYADGGGSGAPDAVALPAAMMLYLTSGRASRLSGRYCSAKWDMAEVERYWKDVILQRGGLLNKLYIPRS
ncbi:hypothetical protein BJV77DRAFT_1065279 [Russula vinacea]|nr:hypothetical protein BJV77DRAFT_1065279 [Russula vinacea]